MSDPFDTLGIEARFALDMGAVAQRHRDLSKALHPDRYMSAPAAERRMALGKAIEVNEAFRAVKDPIRRAEALVRRAGLELGETGEPKASPALLMEMMEQREELAEARQKREVAAIARLGEAMRERERAELVLLGERLDAGAGNAEAMRAALPLLGELRYIRRFLDEVSALEEELAS